MSLEALNAVEELDRTDACEPISGHNVDGLPVIVFERPEYHCIKWLQEVC